MTAKKPRLFTRAEAIERAIDTSDPWDEVVIHDQKCTDIGATVGCVCGPVTIVVKGDETRRPMGFRDPRQVQSGG